jgi:hypothetical protein
MDDLSLRILDEFKELGQSTLDLHALMEAGGNDPESRDRVVYLVAELVRAGMLDEMGSDYYAITDLGRKASGQA